VRMNQRYIIDTNVFIQGKNFHYDFGFCIGFWEWIRVGFDAGLFFSIKKVRDELIAGHATDPLTQWTKAMPKAFFLADEKDTKVMQAYAECIKWSVQDSHYLDDAHKRFADDSRADAFLLAVARAHGYVIVTQEISNPGKRREIPIPDAARKIPACARDVCFFASMSFYLMVRGI